MCTNAVPGAGRPHEGQDGAVQLLARGRQYVRVAYGTVLVGAALHGFIGDSILGAELRGPEEAWRRQELATSGAA
ncbi:hypothetical protein AB0O76_35550 [Streptomyces sp. NPDC086554]|uniref:hypothetical protein n=1 Tax=Streptomyces sp. NPDC086554 TaxID=3154864 RepID=UPI003446EF92